MKLNNRISTFVTLIFLFIVTATFNVYAVSAYGSDEQWSKNKANVFQRNKLSSHFIYIGTGFSVTGLGASKDGGGSIGNNFVLGSPLLGFTARIGYEYFGKIFYSALELSGNMNFSIVSDFGSAIDGLIGLGGVGPFGSTNNIFFNFKPGFSINNKNGSFYAIIGVAYNFLEGNYTTSSGATSSFNGSGFGLNYGVGIKHKVYSFIDLFFEFNAIAPIPGNGSNGLDRTIYNPIDGSSVGLATVELYTLTLGIDFRL